MSKRVLLVDDEEDARTIAQLALEMSTDWTILTASSGPEAIRLAASEHPDVILLDMMMPGMDGRTTLQQLKTNPATQSIPVILATAKVQPSERASLEKLEVIAVFTKPIRPLELAEQILEALNKEEM
ncbi:response regulator [Leptolyngbya sp. NK1-12]|uniref:Response regulator n=1 Tax=Leptolyngbya sp. NK1-12 TaxID=2547451 RepID=A0AA97AKD3_9CYAN|nr:response regulator [Leptolyngbya sp. NK1-12]WNZ27704.1 response regulator [Leptolyngbya sp. NK1-12]